MSLYKAFLKQSVISNVVVEKKNDHEYVHGILHFLFICSDS